MRSRGFLAVGAWLSAFCLSAGCMYDYSQYEFEDAPAETTSPANAQAAETTAAPEAVVDDQGDAGALP